MQLTNKSARPYNIGGVLLSPGVPTEVPDEVILPDGKKAAVMQNPRVKKLMDEKKLEQGSGASGGAAGKGPAEHEEHAAAAATQAQAAQTRAQPHATGAARTGR